MNSNIGLDSQELKFLAIEASRGRQLGPDSRGRSTPGQGKVS